MRINTNVSALNAQRNLGKVESDVSKSMAKLSSGFRITRASDDAAGLGIANVLRADIRAMNQAARNSEQAGSVIGLDRRRIRGSQPGAPGLDGLVAGTRRSPC